MPRRYEDTIVVRAAKGWQGLNLPDLWCYRELLYFLVWRDIKVRYKQTAIGAMWAILQPFMTMVVFSIFFGRMAKMPSEGIPYPIFSYAGLLIWIYFSSAVTGSGASLVGSANLITKVYFPRLIIPLASAIRCILDYLVALSVLVAMMWFYGFSLKFSFILLPFLVLLAFISAAGMGLWFSALNVKYRDIGHAAPFFIQLLLFATPVIYPASMIPERFRIFLALNPISGIIDAHRACILGYKDIDVSALSVSILVSSLIFISGLFYFRKTEHFFADVI